MKWLKSAFRRTDKANGSGASDAGSDQAPMLRESIRTSSMNSTMTNSKSLDVGSGSTSSAQPGGDHRTSSTATSPKKHSSHAARRASKDHVYQPTRYKKEHEASHTSKHHHKSSKATAGTGETTSGASRSLASSQQQQQQQNGSISNKAPSRTSSMQSVPSFKSLSALSASIGKSVSAEGDLDPAMLAALEQAEAAAARVEELQKARSAQQQAALNKAKESTHDAFLRETKLWLLDLAACTADVEDTIASTGRRRERYKKKESDADPSDARRMARLSKVSLQLTSMEHKLKALLDRLSPITVAVGELDCLRDWVQQGSSLTEAQSKRDRIMKQLVKDLKTAGLLVEKKSKEEISTVSDIRDLVHDLIHQADQASKEGTGPRHARKPSKQLFLYPTDDHAAAVATPQAPPPAAVNGQPGEPLFSPPPLMQFTPEPPQQAHADAAGDPSQAIMGVNPLEVSEKLEKIVLADAIEPQQKQGTKTEPPGTPLLESCASPGALVENSPGEGASPPTSTSTSAHGSAGGHSSRPPSSQSTPQRPFNLALSSPSTRTKSPGVRPAAADGIRRMPALVTLHYALQDNGGAVGRSVGWAKTVTKEQTSNAPGKSVPTSPNGNNTTVAPPPEDLVLSFQASCLEDVVDFVQANGGYESKAAGSERWATMQEAAQVYTALSEASTNLSIWIIDSMSGLLIESYRLHSYIDGVAREAGKVAHAGTPLRQRMERHGVPWDESLLTDVRWAAQFAATELMRFALETHAAERSSPGSKGQRRSQVVVQQLGHAVIGAFRVHQFAGGFSQAANEQCEKLIELTVHHARAIDPKWVKNSKLT